jgi:CHAT domain-containing protein
MHKELPEHLEIKKYLLGQIDLDESRERIEQRLMLDEKYYEEILSVEEELIQEYADDELEPADKLAFERNFLISDERREKVSFAKNFRKYVDSQEAMGLQKAEVKKKFSLAGFFAFKPAFRIPAIAAVVLAVAVAGFFGWNAYQDYSRSQQTIAAINKAWKNGRPIGSRISGLGYSSYDVTRGNDDLPIDHVALDLARHAAADDLINLGRVYLARGEFDNAIQVLEEARKVYPKNARVLNDIGVAYLERGIKQGFEFEGLAVAANFFDEALRIDPKLLEAHFNRARALEQEHLNKEAMEEWREYLRIDPSSDWAKEAARRLAGLENTFPVSISNDRLQKAFLDAAANGNGEEALRIVSENRELLESKYLPQKLAFSLVEADRDRRREYLNGMKYLGSLEKKSINDNLAADLSTYYEGVTEEKYPALKEAQAAMREGYKNLRDYSYGKALEKFETARTSFQTAGNRIEGDVIAAHFIGYTLNSLSKKLEAYEQFRNVDEISRERGYNWFSLLNSYWLAGTREAVGFATVSDKMDQMEAGLQRARDIGDQLMIQQFLSEIIIGSTAASQKNKKFTDIGELLTISAGPDISERQKMRNYSRIVQSLDAAEMPAFSVAAIKESVDYMKVTNEKLAFIFDAQRSAAVIETVRGDFTAASDILENIRQNIDSIPDESQRQNQSARNLVARAGLEMKQKAYVRAAEDYKSAIDLFDIGDRPLMGYEAKKLKLLADNAAGNREQLNRDLPAMIENAENMREKLTSESDRNSFFEVEQQVYDIAIDNSFSQQRGEEAFNYAETSSSRSLLDQLQKRSESEAAGRSSAPLSLSEIRQQLPFNTQILQFAVLQDKTLIWVISPERVETLVAAIGETELKKKVKNYLDMLQAHRSDDSERFLASSRELYDLLIRPATAFLDEKKITCIVPNGPLFNLPFIALRSQDKYFIEQFENIYSPSSNVFLAATSEAAKRDAAHETLLSIGNPAFDRDRFGLKDLKDAESEANSIAAYYLQPEILTGPDATKEKISAALKKFDVINYAGHYLVNLRSPLRSSLLLAKDVANEADSFLTNGELSGESTLKANLVVLSACQTGVEGYYRGEGMIGLSRTFLSLGVPLVVASQWDVETGVSSRLMKDFHRLRKQKKLPSSTALREAQLAILRDPSGAYRDPYYWASFAAFGGTTRF